MATSDAILCPHCNVILARKTFLKHKRLYYDSFSGQWVKKSCFPKSEEGPNWADEEWTTAYGCDGGDAESDIELSESAHSPSQTLSSFDREAPPPIDFNSPSPSSIHDHEDVVSDIGEQTIPPLRCVQDEATTNTDNEKEVWEDDDIEAFEEFSAEHVTEDYHQVVDATSTAQARLIRMLVLFLLTLRAYHFIPDIVISLLAKFLSRYFADLGQHSNFVQEIALKMPSSIHQLERFVGYRRGIFEKYVVCSSCKSLYYFNQCSVRGESKSCLHRDFLSQRPCATALLKEVCLSNGTKKLYPKLVYCYYGILKGIQSLLLHEGFIQLCEQWRSRTQTSEINDIYDGRIWSEFMTVNNEPFLESAYNFALMLNIDWFNPFKLSVYSVGVVYLSIMNLPREYRFKRENIILVSLIPGPTEPQRDINSFLKPFVDELLSLWNGVQMTVNISGKKVQQKVRAALLCIASDMPAGRKCCGFLAHSATLGCSRCFKQFPGPIGHKNYSGFERDTWVPRTLDRHKSSISEILKSKSRTERDALESKHGARYTELLRLPYFDPIRQHIVDPMHNLFLGSAKHVYKNIWNKQNLFGKQDMLKIQERLNNVRVPPTIGRIPRKICSHFSSFTAEEWKNWVTIYSVICLHDILPQEHMECWRHFVLACRYLCKRSVSVDDIKLADALLLQFCRHCQRLYGTSCITPNMHMHAHLRDCIQDYGPVYSFWLFSFERYNGILGHQPTNNRSIETQLLERFLEDNFIRNCEVPKSWQDDFSDIFPQETTHLNHDEIHSGTWSLDCLKSLDLPKKAFLDAFSTSMIDQVCGLYTKLYPNVDIDNTSIPNVFLKYPSITLNGFVLGSKSAKVHSSVIIALWDTSIMGPPKEHVNIPPYEMHRRPVLVHHFAKHTVTIAGVLTSHLFVVVSWFMPHPRHSAVGKPVTVWCRDLFEPSTFNIIPVQLLSSVCAYTEEDLNGEQVVMVTPLS